MKDLADAKIYYVRTVDDVTKMLQWLGERRDFLAFDLETSGLNRGCDVNRLAQFADNDTGWALSYEDWRGVIKQVIHTYDRPIVCHNLIFDSSMLKKDGITLPQHLAHDTMVMCFLKNSSAKMSLKGASALYVDKRAAAGKGLLEQGMAGGGWTWGTVPVDFKPYWLYGTLDVLLTSRLACKLYPEIIEKYREAYELELAVIHCLRDAELAGMMTDPDYIERASTKMRLELANLKPQIPVKNVNSDDQIRNYLQGIGVNLFALTEKGKLSVDKLVMRYFANSFPVCSLIEEYRSKSRMLGSYLEKFTELSVDDILRASTHVLGASTSRMSVKEPPLQTLPRGRVVRDAIISRPGHRILQADFSGMEMRALAADAHEVGMLAAFNRGEDIHNFTAAALYGENFTKPQRAICKNAGFAKVYGAGLDQFATTAKIPVSEARVFLERYDELFPGVSAYMERNVNQVMERAGSRNRWGYVNLIDGRRIAVPGEKAYVATNYRIQGSCSVVTKKKIVELDSAGLGNYFRLAVHDELLYEVPTEYCDEAREVIKRVMPDRHSFPGVVLEIEQDEIDRWGQHYRGPDYPKYVETEDPEWMTPLPGQA